MTMTVKTRTKNKTPRKGGRRRGQIDQRPAAGGDCRGRAAGVCRERVSRHHDP